jgi:predicted PurR-regulated permease PerM
MIEKPMGASPHWNRNTKLVITLSITAIAAVFIARFHTLFGPVLFAFILAYLLHPVVSLLEKRLLHSWRMAVNILYLVFIIFMVTLITWGGLNLLGQIQSLITLIQTSIVKLPDMISSLSNQVIQIGPFQLDFTKLDLAAIGQEILAVVQPTLGKLGSLVSSLASSAAGTLGWLAFITIASYFFLIESGGLREGIIRVDIPGYNEDIKRIGKELGRIWNAFLRGQIIIFGMTMITYSILLPILGVRYAIGLALLAATANFLPYIGPAINWIALGLVTFFQVYKPFGMAPLLYSGLVILIALLVDQIYNNLIIPRMMAQALKVHPAAVLISAIIAANLIGVIGLLIAAPLLATLTLIGRYTLRKLVDRDPWPENEDDQEKQDLPSLLERIKTWWKEKWGKAAPKNKKDG